MPRPIVTLCTDFGHQDAFVGTMKGVIVSICPEAMIVDITHEIPPQAVQQAAFIMASAAPFFPRQTVHLIVVDPGVGSNRRPIAVVTDQATYIAPDNGVLSMVLAQDPPILAIHLTEPAYHLSPVSATFHGRDVFAPAAAHLAAGVDPHLMGENIPCSDLTNLPPSQPKPIGHASWLGEVLHVDRFGNLVSNLRCTVQDTQCHVGGSGPGYPAPEIAVFVGGERITGLSRTFADVEPGGMVTYIGSSGYLEIAVREGSAATRLGVGTGEPVWLELQTTSPATGPHHSVGPPTGDPGTAPPVRRA